MKKEKQLEILTNIIGLGVGVLFTIGILTEMNFYSVLIATSLEVAIIYLILTRP